MQTQPQSPVPQSPVPPQPQPNPYAMNPYATSPVPPMGNPYSSPSFVPSLILSFLSRIRSGALAPAADDGAAAHVRAHHDGPAAVSPSQYRFTFYCLFALSLIFFESVMYQTTYAPPPPVAYQTTTVYQPPPPTVVRTTVTTTRTASYSVASFSLVLFLSRLRCPFCADILSFSSRLITVS